VAPANLQELHQLYHVWLLLEQPPVPRCASTAPAVQAIDPFGAYIVPALVQLGALLWSRPSMPHPLRWDIFCKVIDNWGDIGVCWRLAADLGARGCYVRLWTDDASALAWLAPQGSTGVEVLPWPEHLPADGVGDVVLETFGCDIPPVFAAALVRQQTLWLNLEYLSAESYVERCHQLPSPIACGPAAGGVRWFFYPGFTPQTGGLLRETDLIARQNRFKRPHWRVQRGITAGTLAVSLFCYEPPALPQLLQQLQTQGNARLLVTPGRAAQAIAALPGSAHAKGRVKKSILPYVSQADFDELLWACDLNFVRGEDSLVRALWAGQPLVWHIYPQHDNAHHAKLLAFLDWLQAPTSLRQWHCAWNGLENHGTLPQLDASLLAQWRDCIQAARTRLWAQEDLTTQLLQWSEKFIIRNIKK